MTNAATIGLTDEMLVAQVRPGQHQPVYGPVHAGRRPCRPSSGHCLPPSGPAGSCSTGSRAGCRSARQCRTSNVIPSTQPGQRRSAPVRAASPVRPPRTGVRGAPVGTLRVDPQRQAAQEQQLGQRLAVGRPAGELLGQRQGRVPARREAPSPGPTSRPMSPPRTRTPQLPSRTPAAPRRPARPCTQTAAAPSVIGRPADELRHDRAADLVERGAGESRSAARAAEGREPAAGSAATRAARSRPRTACRTPGRASTMISWE